ncbi:MAG: type II secretion system F family protein [Minisyncoccia bacterium]
MVIFNFKAIKNGGGEYSESMEANDRFEIYKKIKQRGDSVVSVEESSQSSGALMKKLNDSVSAFFGRVSAQDKINFARNLSSMVSAGLALSRALSVQERQVHNKKFKTVIKNIDDEINRGKSLSEALRLHPKIFSNLFVSMVKAGEESGGLSDSLKMVAIQMDNSNRLTKKIRGAMIYPSVIVGVIIVIGIIMFVFVLPGITTTFKEMNVPLPLATRVIIGASDFMTNNYILVILLLMAFVVGVYLFIRTKLGKRYFEMVSLSLPVIGNLVKETNSARTARTLSSLISAGVPIAEALKITGDVLQNSFYKQIVNEAVENISKGVPTSNVFMVKTKYYPVFLGEMMSVGEETGKLPEMLMNVAVFYEDEVDQKTKDMSTIIEPVLVIGIGAAVAFFALAMLQPMYSLVDVI